MSYSVSSWIPTSTPTSVTIRTIDSSLIPKLESTLTAALSSLATETGKAKLRSLSQIVRGAEASLTVISAEQVLATATDSGVAASASLVIYDASMNLQYLAFDRNLYKYDLNHAANYAYLGVFTVCLLYVLGMLVKSRYHWYNFTFFQCMMLQVVAWAGRVLSFKDNTKLMYFMMQYFGLTISPTFLLGGIYFLFAQLAVIYGREFSQLSPLWYAYIFLAFDIVSFFVQSAGGAVSAIATNNDTSLKPGTYIMTAGIGIQVASITVFLGFWFLFLYRIYFKPNQRGTIYASPYAKPLILNFFRFLLNLKLIQEYRRTGLESRYNPKFADIRARTLFNYFPLVMTISVILIYVRSLYRIVELSQGFEGYLITHEFYLLIFDALMIAEVSLLFIPFHPVWVFGAENKIKLKQIKKKEDEQPSVQEELESYTNSKEY